MDFKAMIEEQQKKMEELQAKIVEAQAASEKAHEMQVEELNDKFDEFSAKVNDFAKDLDVKLDQEIKLPSAVDKERDAKILTAQAEAEEEHEELVEEVKAEAAEKKEEHQEKKSELEAKIASIRAEAEKKAAEAKAAIDSTKAEAEKITAENIETIQKGMEDEKVQKAKSAQEEYITSLLTYAENCEDLAAAFALEAEAALLEAAVQAADYMKKYGEEK